MDVKEYRKQYEEELRKAAQLRTSYRDILDRSKSGSEGSMLRTATGEGTPLDEVTESIKTIRSKHEDAQLRIAALNAISIEDADHPALIDMALELLRDNTEPVILRRAALRLLQQSSFSSIAFKTRRAEYLDVLRTLVDDADFELRERIIEALAQAKDEYVQRRLVEGLREPSKAMLPPEKSIQMLGYDIHAEYYPILRAIIENPPNLAVKTEAVRLLAADSSSKDLLAKVFTDKTEDLEVRRTSGIALQSLAPKEFQEHAKRIVMEEDERPELRATSLSALDHFGDQESLKQDPVFVETVERLKNNSADLGRAAESYMRRMNLREEPEVTSEPGTDPNPFESLKNLFLNAVRSIFSRNKIKR